MTTGKAMTRMSTSSRTTYRWLRDQGMPESEALTLALNQELRGHTGMDATPYRHCRYSTKEGVAQDPFYEEFTVFPLAECLWVLGISEERGSDPPFLCSAEQAEQLARLGYENLYVSRTEAERILERGI